MTPEEFEQRRRRLEEQLREGIESLLTGFHHQLRALEAAWMAAEASSPRTEPRAARQQEASAVASPSTPAVEAPDATPPMEQSRPPRLAPGQLRGDVEAALALVPKTFNRRHLIQALGYEPERSTLHRVLMSLIREGVLVRESKGAGKIASEYEKTGTAGS